MGSIPNGRSWVARAARERAVRSGYDLDPKQDVTTEGRHYVRAGNGRAHACSTRMMEEPVRVEHDDFGRARVLVLPPDARGIGGIQRATRSLVEACDLPGVVRPMFEWDVTEDAAV